MNTVIKTRETAPSIWDPFQEFDGLLNNFRRVGTRGGFSDASALIPAIDIKETETDYQIVADLPGIAKEDLDVSIRDGVLTIKAESRKDSTEKTDGRVVRQERRVGRFARSLQLTDVVDDAKIHAAYEDGLLNLVLPKKEAATPRKIEVSVH